MGICYKGHYLVGKELKCPICGNIYHIFRKANKDRARGHLKDLYCFRCKDVTKHIEIGAV